MSAEIHPERARLEALVTFAEKRAIRALARWQSADIEASEASAARTAAQGRLAAWLAANPDDQLGLFETTLTGEDL